MKREFFGRATIHHHTTLSDGLTTPQELFYFAWLKKFDVLMITDHNNADAFDVLQDLAKKYPNAPAIIRAMEVTYGWLPGSHMIVILPDNAKHPDIKKFQGFNRTVEEVRRLYPEALIGLPHPALNLDFLLHPKKCIEAVDFIEPESTFGFPPLNWIAKKHIRYAENCGDFPAEAIGPDSHFPYPLSHYNYEIIFPKNPNENPGDDFRRALINGTTLTDITEDKNLRRPPFKMVLRQSKKALIDPLVPVLKELLHSFRR